MSGVDFYLGFVFFLKLCISVYYYYYLLNYLLFVFFLLFLCWVGYIVAFTQVLTMYQRYHTWILPLYHSPLCPTPIPRILSSGIISGFTWFTYTCTHFWTIFMNIASCVNHLYFFFWELSVQFICPFSHWVIFSFTV
jgi:hypothetical protein